MLTDADEIAFSRSFWNLNQKAMTRFFGKKTKAGDFSIRGNFFTRRHVLLGDSIEIEGLVTGF